ncbi:MAG TPA: glycosyltransferase [Gemmatimonadaceae bacterium]|nr:glycosyltransferase [Gemmatimonadaceae bacterium]
MIQKHGEQVDLSVIVPTFNAKALAKVSAAALQGYMERAGLEFEIILVDDGSRLDQRPDDRTLPAGTRLIQLDRNRGKGFAVRKGLLAARGRCRVFTDVDLPYGMDSLLTCYEAITNGGADFVYGDRSLPKSTLLARPSLRRRASSVAFKVAVSTLAGLRPTDTQCGLKGFSGDVADSLVPLLKIDHFAFDVEIFRCAEDNGLAATPIPVQLVNGDVSTVRLLRDSMTMFKDLVTIRRRALRGEYRSSALASGAAARAAVV